MRVVRPWRTILQSGYPGARRNPLLTLIALSAFAQDGADATDDSVDLQGFDAHGFVLAAHDADVRDGLVLQRPGDLVGGRFFAGGVVEYAKSPLILQDPDTGSRDIVLDHVIAANVSIGAALHERIRLDVLLPLFLTSTGPSGGQGMGFGDIRLSAMGAVLRPGSDGGWGLGVVPWVDLPSGVEREYLGQRSVAGGGLLAVTREWERVTTTANVGAQFAPKTEERNLENADALIAGLGGVFTVTPETGVGLEVKGHLPFVPAAVAGTGMPIEAIGSVRHVHDSGGFISGGLAMALSSGAGAAMYRVFVGGGFGANVSDLGPRDRDGDGIVNRDDACPDDPETLNHYEDADGCPDVKPSLTVSVARDGRPAGEAHVEVEADDTLLFDRVSDAPIKVELREGPAVARARQGDCVAGRSEVDVDGQTAVTVELLPVQDALLRLKVTDADGAPLDAASVSLTPSDPECLADDVMLKDGTGTAYLGPTQWAVEVEAPGFHPAREQVTLPAGGSELVEIELTPRLKLERVKVEETGIILLEQVYFDTGRATLRSGSELVLDEVVQALQALPERGRVEVQGHTDNVGSDAFNLKLSQSRSETVRQYLVDAGIPADRLDARGYGETKPRSTNRTPDGRQQNRRVEFIFIEASGATP